MITQERLKEVVVYNEDEGLFYWLSPTTGRYHTGDLAGTFDVRGRPILCIDQKIYKSSRLVWLYQHGEFPLQEIDHIDGDHTNNRLSNLRDVSHRENMLNTVRSPKNTSGYPGVTWHVGCNKWIARINTEDGRKTLGTFVNKGVAIAARKAAEIMYGYHPNHGRDKQIKKNPLITKEELSRIP